MKSKILGLLAVGLFAGPANAVVLNWDHGGSSGGTLMFDGTRIIGTNIGFDLMKASHSSADGIYYCSDAGGTVALGATRCLLSFTSGPLSSIAGSTYIFDSGGTISLAGYLTTATPGNTGPVIAGSPLVLSGIVNAYAITRIGGSATASGLGIDLKDQSLLNYFGTDVMRFTMSQLAINGCNGPVASLAIGFTCNVNGADFQNTRGVPEPGTLALLGLGLAGLGLSRRRKAD